MKLHSQCNLHEYSITFLGKVNKSNSFIKLNLLTEYIYIYISFEIKIAGNITRQKVATEFALSANHFSLSFL